MTLNGDAPIADFQAGLAPGARQKAIGIAALMFSALLGFYCFSANSLNGWTSTQARIDSAYVVSHQRRYSTSYSVDVNALYKVSDHFYAHSIPYFKSSFYSAPTAQKVADSLVNTKTELFYEPGNPGHSLTPEEVSANHVMTPFAQVIMVVTGIIGLGFLWMGASAEKQKDQYSLI